MKKKYKFRFFFDYASGGCLWSANVETANKFENPADATIGTIIIVALLNM